MDDETEVTVELFDTAGQATDLTLRMTLSRDASGAVTVRLEDLHALLGARRAVDDYLERAEDDDLTDRLAERGAERFAELLRRLGE
jgi:hypothetical protein